MPETATPLSKIRAARYRVYEAEERLEGDVPGEHSPLVQSTLSGGLEELNIPFLLFDRAEREIPVSLAEQLRGKRFEPMMEVVWLGERYYVATIAWDAENESQLIPADANFCVLAIVAASLVDLNG